MPQSVPSHNPYPSALKDSRATYNRTRRDRAATAFYHSAPWLKLRVIKLENNPVCERCLCRGWCVEAMHVHHIKPIADHHDLRLDLDNLESLCHSCHSQEHARKSNE